MNHTIDFIDFPALLRQMSSLHVFSNTPESVRRGVKLNIVRSAKPGYIRGTAFLRSRRLRLVIGPWVPGSLVLGYFLHELVHLALPRRTHHNERFRRTLARAAEEAWGITVDPNPPKGRRRVLAYEVDSAIETKLRVLLDQGELDIPLAAATPRPSRQEHIERAVAARAAHAMKMHKRATTRLARAKTLERQWRSRVRYYERKAAKSGTKGMPE